MSSLTCLDGNPAEDKQVPKEKSLSVQPRGEHNNCSHVEARPVLGSMRSSGLTGSCNAEQDDPKLHGYGSNWNTSLLYQHSSPAIRGRDSTPCPEPRILTANLSAKQGLARSASRDGTESSSSRSSAGIGWHRDTSTCQVAGSTAWLLTSVTHFDTRYRSFAKPNTWLAAGTSQCEFSCCWQSSHKLSAQVPAEAPAMSWKHCFV